MAHGMAKVMADRDEGYRRVGYTPGKALSWLLDFLSKDLRAVDVGFDELALLSAEVIAFTGVQWNRGACSASAERDYEAGVGMVRLRQLKREELTKLQSEVKTYIERFLKDRYVDVDLDGSTMTIVQSEERQAGWGLRIESKNIRRAFIVNMGLLLAEAGWSLRRCEAIDCDKLYCRTWPLQRYCSTTCENRLAQRRRRDIQKRRAKI
jgi:hypothetical protein